MNRRISGLTPMRRRAVDRLLVQYLELPETEQAGFLADCRRCYPRLYKWLDRLVEGGHTVTLLGDSVRQLAGDAVQARAEGEQHTELAPGTEIGPWRIVEEIGRGGMGMVYRGERADGAFEMDVAVKLIGRRKRGLAELLQRECRLLAKLDHPAVTRLMDAGLDDRAGPFLVMEWVDGTDLDDWIEAENPSLEQRLELFGQLVEATAHAHQRLIVHGDIKPSNVRVRSDGSVKLMDFGVARLLESDNLQDSQVRALTPSFAAPEQLGGEDITPKTDVWSLGAMLYWLLSGQVISAVRESIHDEIDQHYPRRSSELAAIIAKATADDPAERYASTTELIDDVGRLEAHYPLRAMASSRAYRFGKLIRRNPVLCGAALFTTLLLTGGLAIISMFYLEAEQARQQAVVERDRAEEHAWQLEQVAEFQARQLGNLDIPSMAAHLRTETGSSRDAGDGNLGDTVLDLIDTHVIEATHSAIDEHFSDQPLVKARLIQSLAASRRLLGLYEQAIPLQDEVLDLVERHADKDHPIALNEHFHRALLLRNLGQYEEAEVQLRQALEGRRDDLGPLHRETLLAKRELAVLLQDMGEIDTAGTLYDSVLEQRRQALGDEHPDTIASVMDLGVHYLQTNRLDLAEAQFREALEAQRRTLGPDHPSTMTTLANLGVLVRRQGRLDEAETHYREALQRRRRVLGETHPATLQSINNLAVLYQVLGDIDQAETLFRESFLGYSQVLGSEHPDALYALSSLGVVMDLKGQLEDAEVYLRRAVAGRKQAHGPDHPATLASMSSLCAVLKRLGKIGEAHDYSTHVLEKRRQIFGEEHASTLLAMSNHAAILRELDRLDEAQQLSTRAVEMAREVLPPGHWRLAGHLDQLGRTLAAKGSHGEGESLLTEAVDLLAGSLGTDHVFTVRVQQNLHDLQASSPTTTAHD